MTNSTYAQERAQATDAEPQIIVCRFDPRKAGLERWLGVQETAIMHLMWDSLSAERTVKGIWKQMRTTYEPTIAYTTVMTTMNRLAEKGLIKRQRNGLRYFYLPCYSQEEFEEAQRAAILASLEVEV